MRLAACISALIWLTLALPAAGQSPPSGGSTGGQTSDGLGQVGDAVESIGQEAVRAVVPAPNEPTPQNPRWDGNDAPRTSIMTFRENMRYLRDGRNAEAALARVMQTLPETADEEQALDLDRVLDRFGEINASTLPDADTVDRLGVTRFNLFPEALDHTPIWQQLGDAPDGEIVLEKRDDGSWRFTQETVDGAADLLASIRSVPPKFPFQPTAAAALSATFERTPTRSWLILAACLLGAILAGYLLYRLVTAVGGSLDQRGWVTLGSVIGNLGMPAALLVATLVLAFGSGFARLPPTLSGWRWNILTLLGLVALGWLVVAAVHVVLAFVIRRAKKHDDGNDHDLLRTALPLIEKSVKMLLGALVVLVVVQNLFGADVTGFLAGLGLLGLAVALAAKDTARNYFGTVYVTVTQPFRTGDWIVWDGTFAQVENLGLSSTQVRTVRGEVVTIPNMAFIDTPIENATYRKFLRRTMNIALPYDTTPDDIERAVDLVRDVLSTDKSREQGHFEEVGREPHVTFEGFGSDHLNIRAYYWFNVPPGEAGWYDYMDHRDTVNRRLYRAFKDAEGISFAFPTQVVRITDDTRGLTVQTHRDGDDEGAPNRS
jgi:MscS family membrane protein